MGRLTSIQKPPPEIRATVDALLNAHPHFTLNQLMELLSENDLNVCSRSALSRYLTAECSRRPMPPLREDATVITIMERKTGEVRVLKTPVSAALVAAAVDKLTAKFTVA